MSSYTTQLPQKERTMSESNRIKYLRIALWVFGLTFIFGIYLLTKVWPSGWSWHAEGRSYYLEMILGIYATLGVFLILAARDPLKHLSLIWFTVWSSVMHGGIMAVQSFDSPHNMGHLYGDVFALFAVAAVLALLTPREGRISGA
jgi:FtsH-binding integral membrane protein